MDRHYQADSSHVYLTTKFQWKDTLKEITNNECVWDPDTKMWYVTQETLDQLHMTGPELERTVQHTYNEARARQVLGQPTLSTESTKHSHTSEQKKE